MLDEAEVRELAAHRGNPVVTSFSLDIDGRRYPRIADAEPRIAALCHAAKRRAAVDGDEVMAAVVADLTRIRGWLANGVDRSMTRGVALFSCARDEWFRAIELPVSVWDRVRVDPGPDVTALVAALEQRRRMLVAVTDGSRARIFEVDFGLVEERAGVVDEPEREADTGVEVGGWDRRHEEAAHRHFRRVAAAVGDEARRSRPDGLVLGGRAEDVAALQSHLDHHLLSLLVGIVPLGVTDSPHAVATATLDIARNLEEDRQRGLVEKLHAWAPSGHGAVLGMSGVMAALDERRVGTLVVAQGFESAGARCPACGHVGVAACQCPECGTPSVRADDLVDVAINRALAQHATIEICGGTDLDFFGGIGALFRY